MTIRSRGVLLLSVLIASFAGLAYAERSKSGGKQDMKGPSMGSDAHQGEEGSMPDQQGDRAGSQSGGNADSGSATGAVRDPSMAGPARDRGGDRTSHDKGKVEKK
jgi:hypothetical protein